MSGDTGRTAEWWRDGLDGLQEEPWADAAEASWGADLTDDQRAALEGFDDQPAIPRLKDLGAD